MLSEKREAQTSRCLKWTPSSKRSKKIRLVSPPPPPCLLDTLGRVQRGGGKAVPLGSVAPTKRGNEPGWLLISEPPDQRKNTDPLSKRIFFFFLSLQSGFDYLGELNLKRRNINVGQEEDPIRYSLNKRGLLPHCWKEQPTFPRAERSR